MPLKRRQIAWRSPGQTAASATPAGEPRSSCTSGDADDSFAREAFDLGAAEAERAEDFGGVLTELRGRAAQPAGRLRQPLHVLRRHGPGELVPALEADPEDVA